ncbi:MAG: hypothetical protein ACOY3D_01645 [Candidatus Omnitrophota bacterium]
MKSKLLSLLLILFLICGCAKLANLEELLALQSYSDNQEAQKRYLKAEEEKFSRLLSDVKEGRLPPGQAQRSIVAAYGRPLLITQITDDPQISEEFMYRHPSILLGSEKVFLYFNQHRKLVSAKIVPGKTPEN